MPWRIVLDEDMGLTQFAQNPPGMLRPQLFGPA